MRRTRLTVPWWKFFLHLTFSHSPFTKCGVCKDWEEDA